jgi:hypothetical protein
MSPLRRVVLLASALALFAFAAAAAWSAHDARQLDAEIREDDAAFRLDLAREGLWSAEPNGPGVARLLDVRDDVSYRRAARLFELLRRRGRNPFDPVSRAMRGDTQVSLARAEQAGPSKEALSKAANLDALLVLDEGLGDPQNSGALAERSLADFRRAIRLDPGNEEAMFNLELLMRLLQPSQTRLQLRYGIGPQGRRVPGASSASQGSGY